LKSEDAPEPLGTFVTMSRYFDANLMHDIMTGKSVTDILHLVNKTPLEWYSKKQSIVEIATYGSEFDAAQTCIKHTIALNTTVRYLSVPIRNKSCMCGDNNPVVDTPMQVSAKLHKCSTILSFHHVMHQKWLGSTSFLENQISLIFSVNPGDTHRVVQDYRHCCFGQEIQLIFQNTE
jgi:hypothetical protein